MVDSPNGQGSPLFIGTPEQLRALAKWLDDLDRAAFCRVTDGEGSEEYSVDPRALNKALAFGNDVLGCLNPADSQKCSGLIGELQRDVAVLLVGGLANLLEPSAEQQQAGTRLQRNLHEAMPYFRWLGVRVRDKVSADTKTDIDNDQPENSADASSFVTQLLSGPDAVELTPRKLALLEAYLKQPISLSTIQREKHTTGKSETNEQRNKLILIRDFNRNLQAAHSAERRLTPDGTDNTSASQRAEQGEDVSNDDSAIRLLNIFTNGLADERLEKMQGILNNNESSVDDKLRKIDELIPIPPMVSAANLGTALGVSKTAIQKTTWYIQKRKGQKEVGIERRRDKLRQRGQEYEGDGGEHDDD